MNILRVFKSFFSSDIAIDMGSENTIIYVKDEGIVLKEPTMIAAKYTYGNRDFIEVGNEARKLVGRSPKNIDVISPIEKGAIVDLTATEVMIEHFISSLHENSFFRPSPTVLVAIPSSSSEVEKKAVEDAIYNAGAKEVVFVKQGLAGALGCGLDISSNIPSCILDIGSDTTEISVIASSGIVFSKTFDIGGRKITEAIKDYILEEYQVEIGFENAEKLKRKLSTVVQADVNHEEKMIIKGKDGVTNKPTTLEVSQRDIYLGLFEPISKIIEAIDETFKELPAETISTLFQNGIKLIGGSSKIEGLADLISSYTALKTEVVNDPEMMVIKGCGIILDQSTSYYEHED